MKPQSCGVLASLPPEPLRLALDSSPDLVPVLERALPSLPNALPHVASVLAACLVDAVSGFSFICWGFVGWGNVSTIDIIRKFGPFLIFIIYN